jgi:hypothetical protein
LALGAALGVGIAARGVVLGAARAGVPDDAVALVGDAPIARDEYARAVAAVEADRRDHQADTALRRHVLDRLVDEELLVQRALELGLPTRDPRIRGQLASTMIDAVVGAGGDVTPTEAELRSFHARHGELFSSRARVEIEALFFRGEPREAGPRSEAARARLLAGEPFAAVETAADPPNAPVPAGPLPTSKLADYVGAAVTQQIATVQPAGVTPTVIVPGGAWVARLVRREGGEAAAFEAARADVIAEWRRERDDERLRSWLDARREATRVIVRDPLP